ncbi:response regulator [Hyphomicrobium sp. ghe19]|uniref:response regulator n=1 Tax=Hyphomicrobium sp. ghe19 TaxID=2682968 RepID=UPI001367996E|nr:Transcriptional activator protein CzcR [Hyphomicrobium sp. ghe19]
MRSETKKILCIEDDRETAALICEELTDAGYQVLLAHDGHQGLKAVLTHSPDLVLSDISMPVMSGFAVLERLTALSPRFSELPFVFLTALADRESELKGRRLGADDYVIKPIDFEILLTMIARRLGANPRKTLAPHPITDREAEILAWIARGKTSSEIAYILGLAKRTVDFHADTARVKLNVSTRTEAAVKAALQGIIKT